MPHRTFATTLTQYIVRMVTIGVGKENLAELVALDNLHYALDACRVELIENVVKKKKRFLPCRLTQEIILRKPHAERHTLALALRGRPACIEPVDCYDQIIAMRTDRRVTTASSCRREPSRSLHMSGSSFW